MMSPRPLVFCGPSGVGKSTLLNRLMSEFKDVFGFSVSHTTRAPRNGEKDGLHYHFVSLQDMKDAVARGEFIENAMYSSNMYGTSKKAVEAVSYKGKICILDIDVQGVKQVKQSPLDPQYVFVKPPSIQVLKERLQQRGTETEESLSKRLSAANIELEYGEEDGAFDLVVVNDNVDAAYEKLRSFILPEIKKLSYV